MISSKLLFLIIHFVCIYVIAGQHFAYPEQGEEDKAKQNANNRKPIFLPGKCNENELLYPGDLTDDWVCDCNPAFLYHPPSDKCFPAFRQGPCPTGKVLILPRKKVIPECVTNSCNQDGLIPIRNRCYQLGAPGPCPNPELSYVIGVNVTTLEITCVKQSVDISNRIGEDENILNTINVDEIPICAKGCKRHINGTCPLTEKADIIQ